MKKSFLSLVAVGAFLLSSCGPSAEEKAAAEKATQDSIAAAEQAIADSLAMVATQDSINMAIEKLRQDSIAMADSLASATAAKSGKPAPKKVAPKKEEPKVEEPKKAPGSLKDKISGEPGGLKKDTSTAPKKLRDQLQGK